MSVLTKPAAKPDTKPADTKVVEKPAEKPVVDDKGTKPAEKPAEGEKPKDGEKPAADTFKAPATAEELQTVVDAALETERQKYAAPAKYDAPDLGKDPYLGEAEVDGVLEEAKAAGLTQAQATALVSSRNAAITTQAAAFLTELKADKTIGGAQFDTTVALAQKGLDWFLGTSDEEAETIKAMLGGTGYGNHKALVRRFARIGKLLTEDNPQLKSHGSNSDGAERDHAEKLYGKK